MHTPLKKTFDNPDYLARSRKYDHKCACDICACGKHRKIQENIAVLSQVPSLKHRQPITMTTRRTRWNRSRGRSPATSISKLTMIPTSSSPAIKPPSRLIKFKNLSPVRKRTSMSLPKRPSRERVSTRHGICRIGEKWSALIPLPAKSMHLILPDSKTPPPTNGSFLQKRWTTLPKHSGKPITMSLPLLPSRVRQATKCHSSLTKYSRKGQIRASWIAASTLPILRDFRGTLDTDK